MRRSRHARAVATAGPASAASEMLRALFSAGVDTFRPTFSHGLKENHARVHAAIRALKHEVGRPIGILEFLQGDPLGSVPGRLSARNPAGSDRTSPETRPC